MMKQDKRMLLAAEVDRVRRSGIMEAALYPLEVLRKYHGANPVEEAAQFLETKLEDANLLFCQSGRVQQARALQWADYILGLLEDAG